MTTIAIHHRPSKHPYLDKVISKNVGIWPTTSGVELRHQSTHHHIERIVIGLTSFEDLARAMLKSNPDRAIKAFGEALRTGIPSETSQNGTYYVGCEEVEPMLIGDANAPARGLTGP